MNDQVTQAFRDVLPSWEQIVWFAGILVAAWLLHLALRMRAKAAAAPLWLVWVSGVAFPFLVLALSLVAASLMDAVEASDARGISAWTAFWGIVLVLRVLDESTDLVYRRRNRSFPVPPLLHRILLALFYAAAALGVLRLLLDVNITPLLATSAVLTMVLGFALQGVLGNLLSGLSLSLVRTVEVGNVIRVGETEGRVVHTNWRETLVQTRDDDYVHVPNNLLASEPVTNFSKPAQLHRHHLDVGASYSDAPGDVMEALEEAAREAGTALPDPPPRAVTTAYLDFGINYRLYFWSDNYWQKLRVEGEVARHVWYKFKRRGIEIPFPMSDKLLNDFMEVVYHQRQLPPSQEDESRMAEILQGSEFLSRMEDGERKLLLSEGEVLELARHCRMVRYTKGEILVRQGDPGDACFVVARGAVHGTVAYRENGATHTLEFKTGPGQVFGEMSLLTGAPRTATGRFEDEALLVEIPRVAFAKLLASHEAVMEEIAERTAERNRQNAEFLGKVEHVDPKDLEKTQDSGAIMGWLRGLAGLGRRLLGS